MSLILASPELAGGLRGVIPWTFASRFLAHLAAGQKQFQSERLALVVAGLADEIQRHCGDDTSRRCAAASWVGGG